MISKLIRDALFAQLSDATNGLNRRIVALAPSYGVEPYDIDWDPNGSTNFIFGQVQPDKFEESSVFTYPLLTIDTVQAQGAGNSGIFNSTFSGVVIAIVDVHHTWPDSSVLHDFASLVDLTEDALLSCIGDPNQQNWGGGVNNLQARKNSAVSRRTPVNFNAPQELWMQSLRVQCQFDLTV